MLPNEDLSFSTISLPMYQFSNMQSCNNLTLVDLCSTVNSASLYHCKVQLDILLWN